MISGLIGSVMRHDPVNSADIDARDAANMVAGPEYAEISVTKG